MSIQTAAADSICDFPLAHQVLGEHGISFFVRPKAEQARATDKYTRELSSYDEGQNVYLCPAGKVLALCTVTRSASGVSWLYKVNSSKQTQLKLYMPLTANLYEYGEYGDLQDEPMRDMLGEEP